MTGDYYPLRFNADGYLLDRGEPRAVIEALTGAAAGAPPVSDLWVLAHGWNNDAAGGEGHYRATLEAMREAQRRKVSDPAYRPLFVGVHWPSKAWAADVAAAVEPPPARTTGGGEGEFEARRRRRPEPEPPPAAPPASPAPAAPPLPPADPAARAAFVEAYRPVMDADGVHGDGFTRDFGRLYDLMRQDEPPDAAAIAEFVRILRRYRTLDPHSDTLETHNLMTAPVAGLAERLAGELVAAPPEHERFGLFDTLLDVFRTFTFWQMKARAAVVGETGLYPFLVELESALQAQRRRVRIHLLGHSFGAKLVTAAVEPASHAAGRSRPLVDTLVLLLGAFSQYSFSGDIPVEPGAVGRYAAVLDGNVVRNPVVVIYSRSDRANRVFYPAGMRLGEPLGTSIFERAGRGHDGIHERYEQVMDRYGALGANGAQGLSQGRFVAVDLLSLDESYTWGDLADVACINADGARFISQGSLLEGAHGDIFDPEPYALAISVALHRA
jgi:hypothetical protein